MISRSQFKTQYPVKKMKPENAHFLKTLMEIQSGILNEGVIAQLPDNKGDLYIDHFKTSNITGKHGDIPLENMIITATEPTSVVVGVIDGRFYITLVYEFIDGGFVMSARKFNGHYVVTFFEPSDTNYITSIKKRGRLLFDNKKTP
jgi:hypothetical protein